MSSVKAGDADHPHGHVLTLIWLFLLVLTALAMKSLGPQAASPIATVLKDGIGGLVGSLSSLDVLAEMARLGTLLISMYLLVVSLACCLTHMTARGFQRIRRAQGVTTRLLRLLSLLAPSFVVAIATGSVVSSCVAPTGALTSQLTSGDLIPASPTISASTSDSTGGVARIVDRHLSDPPSMRQLTPDFQMGAYLPWATSTEEAKAPVRDSEEVIDRGTAEETHTAKETHVVAAGQNLWSISEDTLFQRLGHEAELREVGRYWQRLIDMNRDRLIDPANPDYILPGQELRLPG